MAKGSPSAAKRSNRFVLAFAVAAVLAGGSAIAFGNRSGTSTSSSDTTLPNSPTNTVPADELGKQPAETNYSWFDHGLGMEQFDYNMKKLDCSSMDSYLSVDLCGVAHSKYGDFMLVGTEGYWDKNEPDSNGIVNIPLDMWVYTMRSGGHGQPRAVSVLSGTSDETYAGDTPQMELYTVQVGNDQVLALFKHLRTPSLSGDDYWDSLQIIAMSPTGAPTVVATYEGVGLDFVSNGNGIVVSAKRFGSPTTDGNDIPWRSVVTLTPSSTSPFGWDEQMTSADAPTVPKPVDPKRLATYSYPTSAKSKPSA
jgi:hypothetical protein